MYELYGDLASGSCIIEMAMSELSVPYQAVEVSLEEFGQRESAYTRLNPQQKVPSLVNSDGHVLTESLAILWYLIELHDHDNRLLPPRDDQQRYVAIRWLSFVATELYPLIEINDYPDRFSGTGNQPSLLRDQARKMWRHRWLIVENQILGPGSLLPDRFCVTDLYIAVVSRWAQQDDWRPANLPKIEALTDTISRRSACKAVWTKHFSNFVSGQ